jgi:hypothetical protein
MPTLQSRVHRYWVIFDLSLSASFERLYAWLDDRKAVECGENAATFSSDKAFNAVAKELAATMQDHGRGSRIYLIGRQEHSVIGRFVVGRRRARPWEGFGSTPASDEKDEG